MSEMVKRVTSAMTTAAGIWAWRKPGRSPADCPYEVLARAAIEAMRTPTEEMCAEVDGWGEWSLRPREAAMIWEAMIDAALKDEARV